MNWLKKHSIEIPDRKFINELTYREVYDRVNSLAGKLYSFVKDEKRVALYSNNSVDMALFFLALQALEKEVLMLNIRLTDEELNKQLKALDVSVVFSFNDKFISFKEVKESVEQSVELAEEYNREQIAVIMNTSATTGEFKSVPIRWKQIYAQVEASKRMFGAKDEDNWLIILPMFHVSGLTILLRSLYNGTQVTVMEQFDEDEVLKLIEDGKINMISIVPTLLRRIVDRIEKHRLRMVLLGGEFIPRPLVEKSIEKNIPVYKTYGMTETLSQSATFSVQEHPDKIDSVGLPLDGVEILISEPDEKNEGEILIKSPMVMDGYIGREKISGYINTEDIGYIDEDGFLYILDRRKNIIISGGENIYPREIENILYEHPGIIECAVVGKKDEKWGQVPVLYVVSSLDEEAIFDYLSKRLAKYKLPKKIIYLDALPRNASGKILKKDL